MLTFRKIFFALLIASVFFLIMGSCHDAPVEPEKSLIGFVTVVGNEPFTKLALRVENDTYILMCDKATEAELWKMQGTRIIVYYKTMTADQGNKVVDVIRYVMWR